MFHSGAFRRKVGHSSSRSVTIAAAVGVVQRRVWNQWFKFFLLLGSQAPSPSLPHPIFLEENHLGNAWASISGRILAYVGRGMLFADSPGVGPVSLRCGLVRGKQSLKYLLGAYKIL